MIVASARITIKVYIKGKHSYFQKVLLLSIVPYLHLRHSEGEGLEQLGSIGLQCVHIGQDQVRVFAGLEGVAEVEVAF
jgi:hypothetical protein